MRNWLLFANVSCRDFGVYISGEGTFNAPERDYEVTSIPGKNGDLYFDNHRYKNVKLTYPAFIVRNFEASLSAFRSFLLSCSGYQRLEDTYHPDEYRMAVFTGTLEPSMEGRLRQGKFDLPFDCKPQRFLKDGEKRITLTSSGKIHNPTYFEAQPLIRVYGSGVLQVGDTAVTVKENTYPYIDIDTEVMNARYSAADCNGFIEIPTVDFPTLHTGDTGISLGSGITKVEVTPRWWRL